MRSRLLRRTFLLMGSAWISQAEIISPLAAPPPALVVSNHPAVSLGPALRKGLQWNARTDRYEASIPGWPIQRVLARLGGQTGWRIWIEDGIDTQVRAQFRNLPAREALPRILGGLNYALTTSSTGRRELKVFATQARSSTREIMADEGEGVIGNELIVRSKSGSKLDVQRLADLKGQLSWAPTGCRGPIGCVSIRTVRRRRPSGR